MRVVIDTNVLISAVLTENTPPAGLITLWRQGGFHLVSSAHQLDEFMRVTRYPKIRARLEPHLAGRLINELRGTALIAPGRSIKPVSKDPNDDYLLSIAAAAQADFLITGDKRDLLSLGKYAGTKIVTVRTFLGMLQI